MESQEITLVKKAIHRPQEPRHFMRIKEVNHLVTAFYKGMEIARSHRALKLQEAGFDLYDPVYYFPRNDVKIDLLEPSEKTSRCPLKGEAKYFHLRSDEHEVENIAWNYHHPFDRSEKLKDFVAFDQSKVQVVERINT